MTAIISKPLYICLQRPDAGEWLRTRLVAGAWRRPWPMRIENGFVQAVRQLDGAWQATLHARLRQNLFLLRASK